METLYVCGEADISREDGTILIRTGGKKKRIPIQSVAHLVLMSDGTLTTKLFSLCGKCNVRISIFDHYGWFKGSFEPVANVGAGEVKLRQAAIVLDPSRRMIVAREIIRAAVFNMVETLRYHAYRGVPGIKKFTTLMCKEADQIARADDAAKLMGREGMIRRIYYSAWGQIDPRLDFAPRVRRPPNNRINCLISFLNGLTYSAVRHEIAKTHLDETLSFLHAPSAGRSSLSLDLSEPSKPVIVDRQIFSMARKGSLRDEWFDELEGVCMLSEPGRRAVVEKFASVMDRPEADMTMRKTIRKEAIRLQRHVLDMEEYEAFRKGT